MRASSAATSQPETVPATVFAASGPRPGIRSNPRLAYHSIETARAAVPEDSIPTTGAPGEAIVQKPSPPIPFMCGYATAIVAAAEIIASIALPPSRRTAKADWAARECGATAIPRVARIALSI